MSVTRTRTFTNKALSESTVTPAEGRDHKGVCEKLKMFVVSEHLIGIFASVS